MILCALSSLLLPEPLTKSGYPINISNEEPSSRMTRRERPGCQRSAEYSLSNWRLVILGRVLSSAHGL